MTDARKFLESVLVWPGSPQAPGWINLHVNSKNEAKAGEPVKNGGKPWVSGWPFKTVDDLLDRMNWAMSTDMFFNAWVCMSQQSECTKNAKDKPKAVRKAANATWFKAIWIDCDVKAGDAKHYHTMADAFDALTAFRHKVGLPFPSVVVNSGGGLHVYWVSSAPLSLDDWRPYADGLKALLLREGVKCDTGLTTDAARILRVPGTLNHKYSPPRPVELLHNGNAYDFENSIRFLRDFSSGHQQKITTQQSEQPKIVTEPGVDFAAPAVAFAALAPDNALQAGVAPQELHLVDPRPIFNKDGCLFLRHALKTGGADFDQPQWNLSVLCTAFMENGNAFAHEISKGHAGYAAADTQALYDRKVADRADRGIGYPSCAAIEGAGSKHCQGCPLFPKGKSPLNIRPVVTATVTPRAPTSLLLPETYALNAEGKICLIETKVSKGEVSEEWKQLFHNTIDDAYATKTPEALHLHISTDKGNWAWTTLRKVDFAGPGYEKKLAEAGLEYTEHKTKVEFFLMSFLAKMKEAAEQQETVSFGWYRPKGPIEGFAFGGHIMKTDGTTVPAGVKDNLLRKRYQPTGRIADWHTAASYMFRQKRSDFDAIIASSFAAPLMELTGTTGAILASMGDAGSGKSYAMEVAATVWGEHKQTIERKNTSDKSLLHKLGSIGNLPAFWDEISELPVQQRFMSVATQLSGGGEGGRLTQNVTQQERGQWATIININGNRSWRDYVVTQQQDHGAGLRRVLEYWVPLKVLNPQGQVPVSEADTARALLLHNYGIVGEQYAGFLAKNLDQVQHLLHRNTGYFEQKLHPDKKENMWLALCSTLLTGAELANMLPDPVGFNTNRLFDFLLNVFLENRRYMGAANVNPMDTAEDYLAQYLKERFNETIWTMGLPGGGPGRANRVEWRRLQPNANAGKGINVRWDRVAMTLLFSRTNFFEWCHSKTDKRDPNVITRALAKTYNMVSDRKMLAAGTPFKVAQEMIYVVDVRPYQDLRDIMDAFEQQLNAELGTPLGVVGATGTGGP